MQREYNRTLDSKIRGLASLTWINDTDRSKRNKKTQLLFSLAERRLNPNCAVVKWQWVEDAISGFVEFRTSLACFYDELPKPRMFSTFENGKSKGKTFLRTLCIAFSKLMIIPCVVPNLFYLLTASLSQQESFSLTNGYRSKWQLSYLNPVPILKRRFI